MKSATKSVQPMRATVEDTTFSKGERTTLTVVIINAVDEIPESELYIASAYLKL